MITGFYPEWAADTAVAWAAAPRRALFAFPTYVQAREAFEAALEAGEWIHVDRAPGRLRLVSQRGDTLRFVSTMSATRGAIVDQVFVSLECDPGVVDALAPCVRQSWSSR